MLKQILRVALTTVVIVVSAFLTMYLVVQNDNEDEKEEEEGSKFDPNSKLLTNNRVVELDDKDNSVVRIGEMKKEISDKKSKEKKKAQKLDRIAKEKAEKERQEELERQRKLAEEKKRKEEEEKRVLAEAKKREQEAQKRVEVEKKQREVVQQQEKTEEVEEVVEKKSEDTGEKVTKEKEEKPQLASRGGSRGKDLGTFDTTFYNSYCSTCGKWGGTTAVGYDISSTIYAPDGRRIVAVDPNVIPLHSIVHVELSNGQSFEAYAYDTGGDIKSFRLDVLVSSEEEAYRLGRVSAKVKLIRRGK